MISGYWFRFLVEIRTCNNVLKASIRRCSLCVNEFFVDGRSGIAVPLVQRVHKLKISNNDEDDEATRLISKCQTKTNRSFTGTDIIEPERKKIPS